MSSHFFSPLDKPFTLVVISVAAACTVALFSYLCMVAWSMFKKRLPKGFEFPQLFSLMIVNVILVAVVAFVAPQLVEVTLYKAFLVTLAGNVGHSIALRAFPIKPPMMTMVSGKLQAIESNNLCRAIIIAAAMLAMGLGA